MNRTAASNLACAPASPRHATITVQELAAMRRQGKAADLIDVRTASEYAALHAQGARLVPLDAINVAEVLAQRTGPAGEPIYLICRSGGRSAKACQTFIGDGFPNVVSVEGGTTAWEQAGLPVVRGRCGVSILRQVQMTAGSLILIGIALGWFVHPGFFGLSAFVGAGLLFAGLTDTCGMAILLGRMPWNRQASCCAQ